MNTSIASISMHSKTGHILHAFDIGTFWDVFDVLDVDPDLLDDDNTNGYIVCTKDNFYKTYRGMFGKFLTETNDNKIKSLKIVFIHECILLTALIF